MNTKELILPDDWEVKEVVGNKIIIKEKEKALPKTWEEFVRRSGEYNAITVLSPGESDNAVRALGKLLVCRNAWWKQLGWKPDWDKPDEKHCIVRKGEAADKQIKSFESCILAFPTYEVRDQFLDSFRDLIEKAKELL